MPSCPYKLLGIDHAADEAAAKKAYRALMLGGAHPDRGGDPKRAGELGGALQLISEGKAGRRCDCRDAGTSGASEGVRYGDEDFWETIRRAAERVNRPRPRRPANERPPDARNWRPKSSRPAGWEEVPEHPETVDEWSARCQRNAARYASAPGHRGAAGFNEGPWPSDPPPPSDPPRPRGPDRGRGHYDPLTGEWLSAEEYKRRAERRRAGFRAANERQAEENARNEERAQAERETERRAARERQNAQNARPTSTPNFVRRGPGGAIYEPGADNPSERVKNLFRK